MLLPSDTQARGLSSSRQWLLDAAAKARSFSSYAKPLSIDEISTEDEHRYAYSVLTSSMLMPVDSVAYKSCANTLTALCVKFVIQGRYFIV